MVLTSEQKEICDKRLEEHKHENYFVDIELRQDFILKHFFVMKGVFRPETTSGFYLARYLVNHPNIYSGKKVLDLGCGAGIQGIVCALKGASNITFSDISELAIKDTGINLEKYKLLDKANFISGDLFENIKGNFDVIIFNHPFFDNVPEPNNSITHAWFDDGKIIARFLEEAPDYLTEEGIIIMPFFPFAGETNHPLIQGQKLGYNVTLLHKENENDQNLQKGEFCVFSLKKEFT